MNDLTVDRRAFVAVAGTAAIGALVAARTAMATATAYQVTRTPAQWRALLGPQRYNILREEGTERPFSSPLLNEHRRGIFTCAGCALPLFPSTTKFDSHTGWPSFWAAIPNAVLIKHDTSLFIDRTEEHCRRCGGHLGHIFDDGPRPTGKRHCINGLALTFRPA